MTKRTGWKTACAALIFCVAAVSAAPAQRLTTLVTFDGSNGAAPEAPPIQGANGNLYGTADGGGANGYGTVFEISPAGKLTILYDFCSLPHCADGLSPHGGLVQGTNGNLYGTTIGGGNCCGTVFEITPAGRLTTLYSFCTDDLDCPDGAGPLAGLVQGSDGNFYGTTESGGVADRFGTVFQITPAGKLTTLYSFCSQNYPDCTDGYLPEAGLVQGTNGNFYGTTLDGGASGEGTIFEMTPAGRLKTLYSFCGCGDGRYPAAGLVQGADGNFYGTTESGGANDPYGTVFEVTPDGELTTLYSFCSQNYPDCTDGAFPQAGLVRATDGNFYGTTLLGGAYCQGNGGCGTIFEITPSGERTTLYNFCPQTKCPNGAQPYAGLTQATDGSLYGATSMGGELVCRYAYGCGTVFSLSTGLGPFVSLAHNPAQVGQPFGVLGQGFRGTTNVSLNGTPASFTVKSDTFIEATVPPGATTGYVTVTTPSGTLTSNVPFQVIP